MFPESHDPPATLSQDSRYRPITRHIPDQLLRPIGFIRCWGPVALGATVPVASINEDSQPLLMEYEIGPTRQGR
jgi:hypothetical protein